MKLRKIAELPIRWFREILDTLTEMERYELKMMLENRYYILR